jgi:hypothetical protein
MKAACLMFIAAIAVIGALAPGYAAAGGWRRKLAVEAPAQRRLRQAQRHLVR